VEDEIYSGLETIWQRNREIGREKGQKTDRQTVAQLAMVGTKRSRLIVGGFRFPDNEIMSHQDESSKFEIHFNFIITTINQHDSVHSAEPSQCCVLPLHPIDIAFDGCV
jgi:hypothetical protein